MIYLFLQIHISETTACESILSIHEIQPRWRLTGAWLRKVHELFSPWVQPDTDGWLTDETQRHIWKTQRRRPQTGTHPFLLWTSLPSHPLRPTPSAQLLFSALSICLWICHYGNLTPGAEKEGASFRQISITGLIYGGLFRDYDTLMRGQNMSTCTRVWICDVMFEFTETIVWGILKNSRKII